jgi:predicted AAA+ superfamily ATPase
MPNTTDDFPRVIKPLLDKDLSTYPVVALMGARQVGKSTLCKKIAKSRGLQYCTLDDRDRRTQALDDPEGLLADLGGDGVAIDEVQRAPELLIAIKAVVDRENSAGQYLLTGSNQPRVRGAVSDSLQGRAIYRTLRPLTLGEQRFGDDQDGWSLLFNRDDNATCDFLRERSKANGPLDWEEIVRAGGFPRALAATSTARATLLNAYTETYTRQDVREVLGIELPEQFDRFFRVVATRTGHELNFSALARDLGMPINTVRRWVDALERSYMIERIPPYSRNATNRVVQSPKLFFVDSALALAAAREPLPTGQHLETLVANDIGVWRDMAPGRAVHHWRIPSGPEVDFVLEEAGRLLPVEIKATRRADIRDTRHLKRFVTDYPKAVRGVLLTGDESVRVIGENMIAAPWWAVI